MLDLYKLTIFAAVVRAGTFSGAAEQLLLTQPAVSQHIQDLEAGLGTRLFERGRRGVTLTAAGSKLNEYTRAILQLVAEAENAVTDVAQLAAGQIAVGATPGVSVYVLPGPLQEFQARYPNLVISLRTATTPEIATDLIGGRLDFGLIEGELDESAASPLGVQPLETVEQMVVVGTRHPWWARTAIAIEELDGQTFIMRQRNSQTRIWLDGMLHQYRVTPRIGAEFDNMESIKRAVMIGTSLTILPEFAVRAEVEAGVLRLLPITGGPLQRTLRLVWNRERSLSPVGRAFLGCLRRFLPALDLEKVA